MLNKNLDLFLGISCTPNPCFEIIPVNHDYIYFMATASFLKNWHKDNLPEKQLIGGEVLDLHDFPNLPLAGGLGISTVNQLVKRYLESQNICPNQGFAVSDYETQISLCGKGRVAVFCPQFILERVIDYNKRLEKKDEILPFRLKEMSEYIRIDIIKSKQLYTPKYMECFIDILKNHMTEKYHAMSTYYNFM